MAKSDNQMLRDISRRTAVYSVSQEISILPNQSNSEWVTLPNAAPKFASLRVPKNLPSTVTKLTFRIRSDEADVNGYKIFSAGSELEIAIPEAGIIVEPNELIGLSPYLNENMWQIQIRLDDVVLTESLFHLDTA